MTSKVYVVEVGSYSDRYIDAIYTTRDLADAHVRNNAAKEYERYATKVNEDWSYWKDMVQAGVIYRHEREPQAFEVWAARHTMNEFGDVQEIDLWDVLPVVEVTA